LRIWQQYPHAAFTLLAHAPSAEPAGDEFYLGAFDVSPDGQSHSDDACADAETGRLH